MARPEGSMALGYILFEGMHYLTEYTSRLSPTAPQLWQMKANRRLEPLSLPKAHRMRRLDKDPQGRVFLVQAHLFVLRNDPSMTKWREIYAVQNQEEMPPFNEWLLSEMRKVMSMGIKVETQEWHLALGPHQKVKFFSHIWHCGKCFRIEARDGSDKATQDSGTLFIFNIFIYVEYLTMIACTCKKEWFIHILSFILSFVYIRGICFFKCHISLTILFDCRH
jgi:hypothetical protein